MKTLIVAVVAVLVGPAAFAAGRPSPAPSSAPAAIESCGQDGFRLPGSDACLRLGGSVEAQTALRLSHDTRATLRNGAGGRLAADLRVPTDLGPLRVYGSVRGWRRD